jgi:hypothetical protein
MAKNLFPVVAQVGISAAAGQFMDRTTNPDGSDHNGNRNRHNDNRKLGKENPELNK